MLCYIILLLSGFTLKDIKILCGTIKSYMSIMNVYYKRTLGVTVFDANSNSPISVLLQTQENEWEPARKAPLMEHKIVCMCELSQKDPLGFKAYVWYSVALSCCQDYHVQTRCDGQG